MKSFILSLLIVRAVFCRGKEVQAWKIQRTKQKKDKIANTHTEAHLLQNRCKLASVIFLFISFVSWKNRIETEQQR